MELWMQMLQHSLTGGMAILLVEVLSAVVKNRFRHKHKKYLWLLISLWLLVPCSIFESPQRLAIPFPQISISNTESGESEIHAQENVEMGSIMLEEGVNKEENSGENLTDGNNRESLIYNLLFGAWISGGFTECDIEDVEWIKRYE